MKKTLMAAVIFSTCASMAVPAAAATTCLRTRDIDSTATPGASTIVFHMKNGDVWRNTLKGSCPDLQFEGFVWRQRGDEEVCSNQQAIRVIQSPEICVLGDFSKVSSGK